MNLPALKLTKNELNRWVSVSPWGRRIGTSLGFRSLNRIVCQVRLLGWFGPIGPDYGLPTPNPILPRWLITGDCGELGKAFFGSRQPARSFREVGSCVFLNGRFLTRFGRLPLRRRASLRFHVYLFFGARPPISATLS